MPQIYPQCTVPYFTGNILKETDNNVYQGDSKQAVWRMSIGLAAAH